MVRSLTDDNLLLKLMEMEGDDAARVLLILWRTWHVCIRLTHNSEKLNIEGSVKFLTKYLVGIVLYQAAGGCLHPQRQESGLCTFIRMKGEEPTI